MISFLIPSNFSKKNQEHLQLLQQALVALNYAASSSFTERLYDNAIISAVQNFRTDNALASCNNMNIETINFLNDQLKKQYRVCGYLKDEYGMPIEGAEITISETSYTGSKVERGSGISLQNGSYRVYLDLPDISLNKNGLLKNRMNLTIEIKQNGAIRFTAQKMLVREKENIFNFSSDSFISQRESVYQSLVNILSSHGLTDTNAKPDLLSKTVNELVSISSATGIKMETLMRLLFASVLESKATQTFNGKDCVFSGVGAEVFFGFIFQKMPSNMPVRLYNEVIKLKKKGVVEFIQYKDKIAEQINIGISLMTPESLYNTLLTSCKTHIIDSHNDVWIEDNVRLILNKKSDVANTSPLLEGDVKVSDIINVAATTLTVTQKIKIATLFVAHINDFNGFINALNEADIRSEYSSSNTDKLILAFRLSQITRNHVALINAIKTAYQTSFDNYGIRFVATISMSEWISLSNNQHPSDFENVEDYARFVYNNVKKLYPEISAIVQIANMQISGNEKFHYTGQIKEVLLANTDCNILTNRIEDFTIDSNLKSNFDFIDEFKTFQQVCRITPTPEAAAILLNNGITSAYQVYSLGKERLAADFEGLLTHTDIANIYNVSIARIANALLAYTNMNVNFNTTTPYVVPPMLLNATGLGDIPDIEKLFGNADYCECSHDASVYSPAAYLADLLSFLTNCKNVAIKDFLNIRRPDISKIKLNETNTNTLLPYIDLVCEVLEEQVIKNKENGFTRDPKTCNSTLSTQELCAAPEHVLESNTHETAYDIIKNSIYPMYAPLNLNQTESRAYLSKIGIARYDLMETFRKNSSNPTNISIAAEYFGLTNLEQILVTASDNTNYPLTKRNQVWSKDLTTLPLVPGNQREMPIEDFMRDTGLSEHEVLDICKTKWTQLTDLPLNDCKTIGKSVTGTLTAFDRTHRFIRLWRKTGWKMRELDLLLSGYNTITKYSNNTLDNLDVNQCPDTVYNLMLFHKQQKELGLSCEKLLALYGHINTRETYESNKECPSLYKQLFLNSTLTQPANPKLLDIKNNPEKVITSNDYELVAACLSIGKADFDMLQKLYDYEDWNSAVSVSLMPKNLDFLSYVYRHVILSQKLKISIFELMVIIKTQPDPQIRTEYDPSYIDKIFTLCKSIKDSGISIIEYDYLLRYGYNIPNEKISAEATKLVIDPNKLTELIAKLKTTVGVISLPTISDLFIEEIPGTNTYRATAEFKNDLLGTLSSSLQQFQDSKVGNELIKIIEGTTEKNQHEIEAWAKNYMPRSYLEALSNSNNDNEEGKTYFFNIPDNFTSAEALVKRYTIATNLLTETEMANSIVIKKYIAEFYDISTKFADIILQIVTDDGKKIISKLLKKENYTPPAKVIHKSLIFIHKVVILVKKLNMTAEEFEKLLKLQTKLNFNWSKIRTSDDEKLLKIFLPEMLNMVQIHRLSKQYGMTEDENTLYELLLDIMKLSESAIPSSDFCTKLCKLTKWDKDIVSTIVNKLNICYKEFYSVSTYFKIKRCTEILKRIGVSIDVITNLTTGWIIRTTTDNNEKTQNASIKNAVKSLYDLDIWLKELPIIQKPIREAKADALASYLVAFSQRHEQRWKDKIDLYDTFLLDTEMSADTKTSRIVQATNVVQLFVQRCFLSLENGVTTNEPDWSYWEWKKRYRLWEANRKVFLYPENWIEPELRDDKSPFFKELEDELSQNDITAEHAETVFENYLQKLHEVSNLMVIGIYRENKNGERDILHVVGRSRSTPYQYYYRSYNHANKTWSHWERIELDIKSDVVIPMVYNRKLHLFWINATQKVRNNNHAPEDKKSSNSYTEIQLEWSVLKNKKWSSVKRSKKKHIQYGHCPLINISLTANYDYKKNELSFYIHAYDKELLQYHGNRPPDTEPYAHRSFQQGRLCFNGDVYKTESNIHWYKTPDSLNSCQQQVMETIIENMDYDEEPETFDQAYSVEPVKSILYASRLYPPHPPSKEEQIYLNVAKKEYHGAKKFLKTSNKNPNLVQMLHDGVDIHKNLVTSHRDHPFFYQDSKRSFFIEPSGSNNTTYTFYPFYHPYTNLLSKELNHLGIAGILNRDIQRNPHDKSPQNIFKFTGEYTPENNIKLADVYNPTNCKSNDIMAFDLFDAYSSYNWELFFHVPLYIACKLSQNQKYEEAMNWFHYIFDPTDKSKEESPQKFWITKPFFQIDKEYQSQQIRDILENISKWKDQVSAWLSNPYNPHLVARTRIVAFQKTVVMKYLDNLIAWADQLFGQDTRESNNEAALLYMLAYEILGKRPVMYPKKPSDVTFKEISNNWGILPIYEEAIAYEYVTISDMMSLATPKNTVVSWLAQGSNYSNAPKTIANSSRSSNDGSLMNMGQSETMGLAQAPSYEFTLAPIVQNHFINTPKMAVINGSFNIPIIDAKNFCIPQNEKLLSYWNVVEDRLFKLRHCMNIRGIVRDLPLFAPPIDPALLVRAVAAGLSIDDILYNESANQPYYRFRVILQKAKEFTVEVKQLGDKLLSALEKRDAETLSLLRSSQEINMQNAMKQVRKLQIDEAKQNIEALNESIKNAGSRKTYYESKELMNKLETNAYLLNETATIMTDVVAGGYAAAAIFHAIPTFQLGGAGISSPFVSVGYGGNNLGSALNATMAALSQISQALDKHASLLLTKSSYQRRKEEWDFQAQVADMEINQLNKQLIAMEIRLMMAEKELENMDMQIEQSQSVKEYYQYKYTNEELYNWMITEISKIYFKSYELAYQMAKKAEKCFRCELGIYNDPTPYINFGYWDSLKKGLLSGDRLMHDLNQLDAAYIDANQRTLELTKHISLAEMFPDKLIELITTREAKINLEEYLFDMDYPGHYMRRIKSVSVTIPNVAGAHTPVSFMLNLSESKVRVDKSCGNPTGYVEDPIKGDPRFNYQGVGDVICTSNAQNDSGMFELNFGDERYLPFENSGTISEWDLSFPAGCDQIDLTTVSDVILHINYTALYGGKIFAGEAKEALQAKLPEAGRMIFSLKHGFPTEWRQLSEGENAMNFELKTEHLPFFLRGKASDMNVLSAALVLFSKKANLEGTLTLSNGALMGFQLSGEETIQCGDVYLYRAEATVEVPVIGDWTADYDTIDSADVEDVIIGFNLAKA